MRAVNPEWDLMGRTYLVLSLVNMAKREPAQTTEYLKSVDQIIDETLQMEAEYGPLHFLMPYARAQPWVLQPPRSQFVDSEMAMMLAARRALEDSPRYAEEVRQRIGYMLARMEQSELLCAESYPDECWLFCNTMALAAIRLTDVRDGSDHAGFLHRWVQTARARLIDPKTGLLISSFSWRGEPHDGPEGSSIWMAAHCLQLVDREFAADQYTRAAHELARTTLGFGYAREWPASWRGPTDVDSGPLVPTFDASAGSSGLACVAASAFEDPEYLRRLMATLDFAAFPLERDGGLRYCASNQVGDAVLMYAMTLGPLWNEAQRGRQP